MALCLQSCGLGLALLPAQTSQTVIAASSPGPRASEYEEPRVLTGSIYSRDTKQLLFKFKRVAERSGASLKVERDFAYPRGKLAAREQVVYAGDALVSYRLDEPQTGAGGTATILKDPDNPGKGSIQFEYSKEAGSPPKRHSETLRENTLIADMVGPFLLSHWEALRRGEKVKCRYIVVPRMETVGFTFSLDAAKASPGNDVLTVKMEPTSSVISVLVDPLFFTIEAAPPHRVLQYVGRTTPKILVGQKWKDLDAVTIFDWESAR